MKKLLFLLAFMITNLAAQTAEEILKRAEDAVKGETAYGIIRMTIKTPEFTRTLEMESWWQGNEKALIITKSPKKEAGNKTLKIGNEIWSYLRNTETTIKIPPSMMLQSWNGSDFTNDDLVRESNLNRDYDQSIIAEEEINGMMTWKIELKPKPDAPVVWGKIYYWVRMDDYLPSVVQYYDEKENLIRYLVYSDVKKFHGRLLPSKWTMYNKAKEGRYTAMEVVDMKFDIKIPPRIFSFQELERGN
jgi:outer membrane lipoprotein-sorting protein